MTWEALVKFCRAFDSVALAGPPLGTGTVYGKLRLRPWEKTVPLLANHGE